MLARLSGDGGSKTYPTREVQLSVLQEFIDASLAPPRTWRRGDVVRFHGPEGHIRNEHRDKCTWIYWRPLSGTREDLLRVQVAEPVALVSAPQLDCLIASYDGDTLRFATWCSAFLLPDDEPGA